MGAAATQINDVRYNQYGVAVNRLQLSAEDRDGILVFEAPDQSYKLWFDNRVQVDGATFFGNDKNFDKIGDGVSIRRARFAVKAKIKDWYGELDMNNYKIEKLPKMQKSGFEKWMAIFGGPLAAIAFIYIYWFAQIPFLDHLNFAGLKDAALARYDVLGAAKFVRANYAMLAVFTAAIILWVTEPIPNYLTSLLVILGIVLTHAMMRTCS